MKATLRLRRDELAKHRERTGLRTNGQLAAAMGVNRVSVSNTLRGKSRPSGDFLASLLAALGATFADLFEVVPHTEGDQIDDPNEAILASSLEMLPRLAPRLLVVERDLAAYRVERGRATPQDVTYLAALREEITRRQTTPTP